jgi:hypothetical protein
MKNKIIIILSFTILFLSLILITLLVFKQENKVKTTSIKPYNKKIIRRNLANPIVPNKYLTPESVNRVMQRLNMFINIEIPESFSWREKLGDKILPVLDQGECGDCWAYSSVSTLADRYAVYYFKNNIQKPAPDLSVLWVVSNYKYYLKYKNILHSCTDGGNALDAILFFQNIGCKVNYCWPTPTPEKLVDFPQPLLLKDKNCCYNTCIDGKFSNLIYKSYGLANILFDKNYSYDSLISKIQGEIMTNGPVVGVFNVFYDFQHFWDNCSEDDVYIKSGDIGNTDRGWHAVEIVGWGKNSKGIRYWEVKNSWGTSGGFNKSGYFKMAFSIDIPKDNWCFLDIPEINKYMRGGMIAFDIKECPPGYYCPYNYTSAFTSTYTGQFTPEPCPDGNYACPENSLYPIYCPKNTVPNSDKSNCCYNTDVLYKLHDYSGLRNYDLPYDYNNVDFQFPCCNGLNYDPNNPFKDSIPIPFDDPKAPGWTGWKCNK